MATHLNYAHVTSKFSNRPIVVDPDPDGDLTKAKIAGYVSLVDGVDTAKHDTVSSLPGFGGNGGMVVPNVYNGWVQNLPATWKKGLTAAQQAPIGQESFQIRNFSRHGYQVILVAVFI